MVDKKLGEHCDFFCLDPPTRVARKVKLAKTRKPTTFKPLEGFKNGEINKTCLRLDTQDHVSEVLSLYKFF